MTGNAKELPGADLVEQGLTDLAQHRMTEFSLLLLVAAPRLKSLGVAIPNRPVLRPEHQLYALLEERFGGEAHSQYNSLIRRIVSYARALERRAPALKSEPG